jgi:hypothetical protein
MPKHRLHGGRLAGAVGADDHGDLALVDADGAIGDDVGAAIAAGHALADQIHQAPSPAGSVSFLRGAFFSPRPR